MTLPGGPATPVTIAFEDLLGAWALVRRAAFRRGGGIARFRGRAVVTMAGPGVASYEESGRLVMDGRSVRATRRYWIRGEAAGALALYFADLEPAFDAQAARLFVRLERAPDGALVGSHRCGEDRYEGRYARRGPGSIAVLWRVAGPRKEGTIHTRWIREAPSPSTARRAPATARRAPGAGRP